MPILAPTLPAPRRPLSDKLSNVTIPSGLVVPAEKVLPPEMSENSDSDRLVDEPSRKIPRIILAEDAISDVVTAQLATSILGHVLFLKNQVPL
jgi:hypothetical protein